MFLSRLNKVDFLELLARDDLGGGGGAGGAAGGWGGWVGWVGGGWGGAGWGWVGAGGWAATNSRQQPIVGSNQ